MNILCPIHKTTKCVKFRKKFNTKQIVELYKTFYNINTEIYFNSLDEITQYICTKTKYIFFYPYTLAGDHFFYAQLSACSEYYLNWKWEYKQALKWISKGDTILEIACGNGNFLKEASKKASYCVGIDFSAKPYKDKNIEIIKDDYLEFLTNNSNKFDVIVSFQFIEHVSDINNYFNLIKKSLNTNGRLILSTPDNKSIIIKKEEVLNFPPHHMGWWTKKSLKETGEFFGFKTIFVKTEPLPRYLVDKKLYKVEKQRIERYGFLGKVLNRIFHRFYLFLYLNYPSLFKGHTFLIVMNKK